MPILKKLKKAAKEPEQDEIPMHHVGDDVTFEDGGETYEGTISKVNTSKENCIVDVGDDKYEVEFSDIKPAEVEEKSEPKAKLKKATGKKTGKGSSLASLFNKTKAAAKGGAGLPDGSWEALVVGAELDIDEEKGTRGILEYCIVGDEDNAGKTGKTFYGLTDPSGESMQGMEYFKRDLGMLGIDVDELELADDDEFQTLLETLASEEPWVTINVQPQKSNPAYKSIYLNGLMENQDDKPERPVF